MPVANAKLLTKGNRTALVWFLMGRVLSLQTGRPCETVEKFPILPLPSSRLQWEASGHTAWEQRVESSKSTLCTLGNLIQTHQQDEDTYNAPHLDHWNARNDGLGMLLNLAVAML